jgi:WD40 repeat protein
MKWVSSLKVSADGNRLFSAADDQTAILWDLKTAKKKATLDLGATYLARAVISEDWNYVAAGMKDNTVALWDTTTGKQVQTLQGHRGLIRCVALTPDGKRLWSSGDGMSRLWDTGSGKALGSLMRFERGKEWLIVSSDGYFDGSEGAWKHVYYREVGTKKLVDDDKTRKRFYRPGLLATLLKWERPK